MTALLEKSNAVQQYRPQLDSLRCIAVLAVFYSHSIVEYLAKSDGWGAIGVKLFFVLSGFLITRIILLNECPSFLPAFYARRFLRIFPIYYLVLGILFLLGRLLYPEWCLTYLFNYRCVFPDYHGSKVDHFWSLAVEEQFYLIFPALLLACPKRLRTTLIVGLIIGAIIFRAVAGNYIHSSFAERLLPICGEFLLWGALAGYIDVTSKRAINAGWILALGFSGAALTILLRNAGNVFHNPIQTLTGLSFALIVFGLWRTENTVILKASTLPPVVYLGKISYGIYIIHFFCFDLQRFIVFRVPMLSVIPSVLLSAGLAVGLASLSWHFFEEPINRLKSKFPYNSKKAQSSQPAALALQPAANESDAVQKL